MKIIVHYTPKPYLSIKAPKPQALIVALIYQGPYIIVIATYSIIVIVYYTPKPYSSY